MFQKISYKMRAFAAIGCLLASRERQRPEEVAFAGFESPDSNQTCCPFLRSLTLPARQNYLVNFSGGGPAKRYASPISDRVMKVISCTWPRKWGTACMIAAKAVNWRF